VATFVRYQNVTRLSHYHFIGPSRNSYRFQAIAAAALIGIAMFYLLEFVERRLVFRTTVELE